MVRLDDLMSGSAIFRRREVLATSTNTVMAVDVIEPWGAVFELQIAARGYGRLRWTIEYVDGRSETMDLELLEPDELTRRAAEVGFGLVR